MEISARSYLTAGMALTTASATAFATLISPQSVPHSLELPRISTSTIELKALITPADIAALINNLNIAVSSVSSTATSLVGVPGQTLAGALNSAAALNNTLWNGLIAATPNPTLVSVLNALRATANGGLTALASTVGAANTTLVLTTGQLTDVLTSTLTGSLGTALQAVANIINNPLSVAGYTGLLTAPLGIAGFVIDNGLAAASNLGVSALSFGTTLVTGVTSQISNILATVNALLSAPQGLSDNSLFNGALTALQGILSAPVTAAVAGVDGVTSALAGAGSIVLTKLTNGATAAVNTWLGNGTTQGAVAAAINTIGANPLSPASYANALSVLVGAAVTTANTAVATAGSLVSVPFTTGANLTTTAANMITSFSNGLATTAAGLMQMAGLSPLLYNLPHVLVAGVNIAVNLAASATSTVLNVIGGALDFGSALTGAPAASRMLALCVPAASSSMLADAESSVSASDPQPAIEGAKDTSPDLAAGGTTATTPTTEEATAVEETEPKPEDATVSSPVQATVPEKTDATTPTATEEATAAAGDTTTKPDITTKPAGAETSTKPAKGTTTGTAQHPSTTEDATSNEPKTASEPKGTQPRSSQDPKDGSEKDSDKKDEPKKSGADNASSSGANVGGKHTPGAVKNGTTVNEIKSKLDKEAAASGDAGASHQSAGAGSADAGSSHQSAAAA